MLIPKGRGSLSEIVFESMRRPRSSWDAALCTLADDEDDLTVCAGLDEADKADRNVVPVIDHEEAAALVEQMCQDRQLGSVYRLRDDPGHIA